MRKLLILMLVLGMASMAMATPTITVSNLTPQPGDTIQVYITGTAAEASTDGVTGTGGWSGFLGINYAVYSFTGGSPYLTISPPPTIETAAGGMAYTATTSAMEYFIAAANTPWSELDDVDVGLWFTYDVDVSATALDGDSEVIDLLDNAMGNVGQVTIDIIPEPMTLALLGLGGLFLRRRK